jgi:hypothetical protein
MIFQGAKGQPAKPGSGRSFESGFCMRGRIESGHGKLPYQAPAGDREARLSAASLQRFVEAAFTAAVWAFNVAVIVAIVLFLALALV